MFLQLVNERPSDMATVRHVIKVASIDAATFTDADRAHQACCELIVSGQCVRIWGDHRAAVEAAMLGATDERIKRVEELTQAAAAAGGAAEVVRAKVEKDWLAELEYTRTGRGLPPGSFEQAAAKGVSAIHRDENGVAAVEFAGGGCVILAAHEAEHLAVAVGEPLDVIKLRALWRDDYRAALAK